MSDDDEIIEIIDCPHENLISIIKPNAVIQIPYKDIIKMAIEVMYENGKFKING